MSDRKVVAGEHEVEREKKGKVWVIAIGIC